MGDFLGDMGGAISGIFGGLTGPMSNMQMPDMSNDALMDMMDAKGINEMRFPHGAGNQLQIPQLQIPQSGGGRGGLLSALTPRNAGPQAFGLGSMLNTPHGQLLAASRAAREAQANGGLPPEILAQSAIPGGANIGLPSSGGLQMPTGSWGPGGQLQRGGMGPGLNPMAMPNIMDMIRQPDMVTMPMGSEPSGVHSSGAGDLAYGDGLPSTPTGSFAQFAADPQERYAQVVAAAKQTYPNNPAMAKLAAAQAIHESRLAGRPSGLAMRHNNLFGIKGKGTAGTARMRTREVVNGRSVYVKEPFARNATIQDSFQQHRNLMSDPRYKSVLGSSTFEDAAKAIKQSGYATDPHYTRHLIRTYNKYLNPYFQD